MNGHPSPTPSAPWLPPLARAHTLLVTDVLHVLYPSVPSTIDAHVLRFVEGCLQRHPPSLCTKSQAALHEAGHFVAFEAEGMVASSASIHGTRSAGWGGGTACLERPLYEGCYSASNLLSEARVSLAGPWSEHLLGGGDFRASTYEIIEALLLVARAASMLGQGRAHVLAEVIAGTAAIVDSYSDEIKSIAKLLERRKHIFRSACKEALSRVWGPVNLLPPARSQHIDDLGKLITRATPDIERLIAQVTMLEMAA